MKKTKYAIGVDLGGTKISAGLIDVNGIIVNKVKLPTEAYKGANHVINTIIKSIELVCDGTKVHLNDVCGAAIGSPGPMDSKKGIVFFAPNLPGWKNIRLRDAVQKEFKFPVYIDNDANLAAYGEHWIGTGKGTGYFMFITLGTGVGGGLIFGNEIYHGAADSAAEIGHVSVFPDGRKCNCGNYGCIERYSSATGIIISAKEEIKNKKSKTVLSKINNFSSEDVYKSALKKDKVSIKILNEAGKYLGIVLSNTVNLLNLDMIAIGGNVAEAGHFIMDTIRDEIKKRSLYPSKKVKVVKAKIGVDAGIVGAARLVFVRQGYGEKFH